MLRAIRANADDISRFHLSGERNVQVSGRHFLAPAEVNLSILGWKALACWLHHRKEKKRKRTLKKFPDWNRKLFFLRFNEVCLLSVIIFGEKKMYSYKHKSLSFYSQRVSSFHSPNPSIWLCVCACVYFLNSLCILHVCVFLKLNRTWPIVLGGINRKRCAIIFFIIFTFASHNRFLKNKLHLPVVYRSHITQPSPKSSRRFAHTLKERKFLRNYNLR